MTLKKEILHLISLQQEGDYWDYKKQWHENKTDLLHDIICMANNLANRTAYIIIGIDESCGYAVVDVRSDPNRRNTQNIVDFLKDKKFAGGIRPLAHVEQLPLDNDIIDIIVIENSYNTPFYLTEKYDGVRPNHIYTRVYDTNTPIDKSADINHIESLWKKRFHLNETPINKFRFYLKNVEEWKTLHDVGVGYYYQSSPEYIITNESDDLSGYEYYLFGQVDTRPHWWLITLKYHQTAIGQFQGISLDGGRCFVVAPERADELQDYGISQFGFYVQGDLRFRLLQFFLKQEPLEYSFFNYMKKVIVFRSQNEFQRFVKYVKCNIDRYRILYDQQGNTDIPPLPALRGYDMEHFRKECRDVLVLKKMYREFRNIHKYAIHVAEESVF